MMDTIKASLTVQLSLSNMLVKPVQFYSFAALTVDIEDSSCPIASRYDLADFIIRLQLHVAQFWAKA